ncbi:MAG: NAD(P)-binding protein [Chthoniobacterales bacterium]|nr:NAD(P)-binding protein [Chthoniobacterales bacterium]
MSRPHYVIVGAGLAGSVVAQELAQGCDCRITVYEERDHIAGNCHTERDPDTQVMVHKYGPHIFNTNREDIWNYVNRYVRFRPYVNRVKVKIDRGVFSFPINLHTINQFFDKTLNPTEARAFIASLADKAIDEPANFEEQALKMLGRDLYDAFFYGYTKKQWGCEPRELPASILKRLPVRFNYNDSYYDKLFQGIPEEGYTQLVRALLDHERITVLLNAPFEPGSPPDWDHLFYTGPLDAFYQFKLGRLGYRTVTFERIEARGDFQGNAVINYPGMEVPFTRIHEHKHFAPWERHDSTVAFREFSKETESTDVPYYPKRLGEDLRLLQEYVALAKAETATSFLGRLGTYRYLNMDEVIGESLDFATATLARLSKGEAPFVFAKDPSREPA